MRPDSSGSRPDLQRTPRNSPLSEADFATGSWPRPLAMPRHTWAACRGRFDRCGGCTANALAGSRRKSKKPTFLAGMNIAGRDLCGSPGYTVGLVSKNSGAAPTQRSSAETSTKGGIMKICCGMAALMAVGLAAGSIALAQPEKKPATQPEKKPAGQPDKVPAAKPGSDAAAQPQLPPGWTEADMKACMEAGTPGPMHAYLAKGTGVWTGKCTMWMAPNTEPTRL